MASGWLTDLWDEIESGSSTLSKIPGKIRKGARRRHRQTKSEYGMPHKRDLEYVARGYRFVGDLGYGNYRVKNLFKRTDSFNHLDPFINIVSHLWGVKGIAYGNFQGYFDTEIYGLAGRSFGVSFGNTMRTFPGQVRNFFKPRSHYVTYIWDQFQTQLGANPDKEGLMEKYAKNTYNWIGDSYRAARDWWGKPGSDAWKDGYSYYDEPKKEDPSRRQIHREGTGGRCYYYDHDGSKRYISCP